MLNSSRSSRQGIEVRVRPTEADELSEMVTGTGPLQRTRANHVFNKAATSSVCSDLTVYLCLC